MGPEGQFLPVRMCVGPRSAKIGAATRRSAIRQEESRWDDIATEHPGAGEPGAGRASLDDASQDDASLGNPAFRSRLDELLQSAIEQQGREQQGFMAVLQSSRDAITAVRSELGLLRGVIEHREQAVVDLLDGRLALAARQDTMEFLQHRIELLEGEQAALKKSLTVKLDAIARSLEAVEWRTQEGMAALANRVAELESSFSEHARSVVDHLEAVDRRDGDLAASTVGALKELGENIEARQQEVAEAILKALDPVGRIMQVVQSRLVRAASELGVAQGSLFARLAEREERLERQRDRILSDLLDEFAGIAKPRERNRIAAGLREADTNRRERRDAGRTRRRDDGLPSPPLDAYGAGPEPPEGQPPLPGNHVAELSGPHYLSGQPAPDEVSGLSDPAPAAEQEAWGRPSPEHGEGEEGGRWGRPSPEKTDAGRRGRRGPKPPL